MRLDPFEDDVEAFVDDEIVIPDDPDISAFAMARRRAEIAEHSDIFGIAMVSEGIVFAYLGDHVRRVVR